MRLIIFVLCIAYSKIGWLHVGLKTPTWTRGTEFKISYNGSSYINFDSTQAMIDKF